MKVVLATFEEVLRLDPIVVAFVGRDSFGKTKIARSLAPKGSDWTAPYLTYQRVPGSAPRGTYADKRAIEATQVQLTNWGRNSDEAWDLFTVTQEALDQRDVWDVALTPYRLFHIIRLGDEQELPDEDTDQVQVPVTYSVQIAR